MKRFSSFLFLLVFTSAAAASAPSTGTQNDRFTTADQAFGHRNEEANARAALEMYRKAYAETPNDPQAAWRLAMGTYFVGLRLTEKDDAKKKLHAEGRDAAYAAVKIDPRCAPCHFWGAINQALYGEAVGVFKMLFSLKEIEEHLKKSVEIDPKYASGGAYRLLGLIEQKLPGILGGNNKEARAHFEQALNVAPDEPLNYLFMAELVRKEFDDDKLALELAKKGTQVPQPTPERVESLEAIEQLRKLITKLEKS